MQDSSSDGDIKLSQSNRNKHVYLKGRKQIMIDNFLGGISWGLGTVIGATLIVGILGLLIVRTRTIPLIGDVIQVITTEIQLGVKEFASND